MKRGWKIAVSGAILVAATVFLWQWRFERVPAVMPWAAALQADGFSRWQVQDGKYVTRGSDGDMLSIRLDKPAGAGQPQATLPLGSLEGARFLHIRMQAAWDGASQAGESWAVPRAVIYDKTPDGTTRWPLDHGVFGALGTRDWHTEEAVFDLLPDMTHICFSLQHLGAAGTLRVRALEIQPVRQRAWFPWAAAGLLAAWTAWCAAWAAIYLTQMSKLRRVRALGAAACVVVASWFLVFPQTRFSARTLAGDFQLGPPVAAVMPAPAPAVAPAPPVTPVKPLPPLVANPPPAVPPPPVVAPQPPPAVTPAPPPVVAPPPVPRVEHVVDREVRKVDHVFHIMHMLVFAAFGCGFFACALTLRAWPPALAVALLSEAVPAWQFGRWYADSYGDVLQDLAGLAVGAIVAAWGWRFARACLLRCRWRHA